MQAVELRIPGEYWDSFVYDNFLYLFTQNGDIEVYNWDRLLQSLAISTNYWPIFWQFMARGRAWYKPELQTLLASPPLRQQIDEVRQAVTSKPYSISSRQLRQALTRTAPSPAHPHTDVEAFYNYLYLSSSAGVHYASLKRVLESDFDLINDIPTFRVACSYGTMALAAGSEGIFEQILMSERYAPERYDPVQLSDRTCIACSWASFDVIATAGPRNAGYVAAFSAPRRDQSGLKEERHLIGLVDADDLFSTSDGLLFGAADLLVLATNSALLIDGWNPYKRRENGIGTDVNSSLLTRREIKVERLKGVAIDAAATVFGIVIELEDSLLVIGVDGSFKRLREPVNWRCFPRSQRYLNQMHVTYDDHVRIYGFIDDYFIPHSERGPAIRRPRDYLSR